LSRPDSAPPRPDCRSASTLPSEGPSGILGRWIGP
jgi:hypothetical protein